MKAIVGEAGGHGHHPLTDLFREYSYLKVFEFLVTHRFLRYTITDLSRHIKVSRPTLYKVLEDFEKDGLVEKAEGKYTYGSTELADQMAGAFALIAMKRKKRKKTSKS